MEGTDSRWGHDPATQISSTPSAKQPCFCGDCIGVGGGHTRDRTTRRGERQAQAWARLDNYFGWPKFLSTTATNLYFGGPVGPPFCSVELTGPPLRSSLFAGPKLETELVVRRVCPWE